MSPAAQPLHYSVFGLRIGCDFPLPELCEADGRGGSDVTVRLGSVPAAPEHSPGIHAHGNGVLLVVDKIARYWIGDGSEIIVAPDPSAADQNVRLFLLGSALGILIHQRGLLPLHANSVEIDGVAFSFMGSSGAGKSTLAAWFHDQGHKIIADDVSVVSFDGSGRPMVCPGVPRLRLWREALEAMGRSSEHHSRSYHGDESYEKYDVPIPPHATVLEPRLLAAIYLLGASENPAIEPLVGLPAAEAIFANTYRGAYVRMANSQREHWSACVQVVRTTQIFLAGRRLGFNHFDDQCIRLLDHSQAIARKQFGCCQDE